MNNTDYSAAFVPPRVVVEYAVSRKTIPKNGQYLQNIGKYYNYDHLFSFDRVKN